MKAIQLKSGGDIKKMEKRMKARSDKVGRDAKKRTERFAKKVLG